MLTGTVTYSHFHSSFLLQENDVIKAEALPKNETAEVVVKSWKKDDLLGKLSRGL